MVVACFVAAEYDFIFFFSAKKRQRDNAKCYNQRNATRRRDKQTGLSTVFYK